MRPALPLKLVSPCTIVLLCARPAVAAPNDTAPSTVVVTPAGRGQALVPTAEIAAALVRTLNQKTPGRARLGYLMPDPPAAPVDDQAASALFAKAVKSFEMLDFSAVGRDAGVALQTFKQQLKSGGPPDAYVRTLHLLAAAALFDGNEDEAFKLMNDAVLFDPAPPSRKRFNPTVQQLHRRVRERADSRYSGTLEVDAPGALVWFNRRLHGLTAGPVRLRAGLYLIEVFRPAHHPYRRWMRLRPDQSRKVQVKLKPGGLEEGPMIAALRADAARPFPGEAVANALDIFEARELALLTPTDGCTAQHCQVALRWAAGRDWIKRRRATHTGDAAATAKALLGAGPTAVTARAADAECTLDNQCSINERCVSGRCERPTAITRKWWFWALVGVGAAVATVAIVAPLTRPDGPVIEVR